MSRKEKPAPLGYGAGIPIYNDTFNSIHSGLPGSISSRSIGTFERIGPLAFLAIAATGASSQVWVRCQSLEPSSFTAVP